MEDKRKLHKNSCKGRIFTINKQKHCTTYRELIGVVFSLRINENKIIVSDHYTHVLNNQKPISAVLPRKENFLYHFSVLKCNQPNSQNFFLFVRKEKIYI